MAERSSADILDLMVKRHSVRVYEDKAIEEEKKQALEKCISNINEKSGLSIKLVTDEPNAFNNFMAHYGKFSGVANYIVLAGNKNTKNLSETTGYWGEELVLKAQELGLNTCWVALTFSKRKVKKMLAKGEKLTVVIALGYGKIQGRPHKSKEATEISNLTDSSPEWFKRGIEAALLAPTAMNQQSFYLELRDQAPEKGTTPVVVAKSKGGFYSDVDLGIVRHDFEIIAGKDSFAWG